MVSCSFPLNQSNDYSNNSMDMDIVYSMDNIVWIIVWLMHSIGIWIWMME